MGAQRAELPAWLWIGLPPVLICAIPVAWWLAPDFHERWFDRKEGPIEWATVVLLVVAVAAGFGAWRHRRALPDPRLGHWVLVVTLGALYIGLEEISWGQQLVGWRSPEVFEAVNEQGETNLHNISTWFNEKPRAVFSFWVGIGGIAVPLWLRRRFPRGLPVSDWRGWFWPTLVCVPTAICAILVRLPDRIEQVAGPWRIPLFAEIRLSEPQEFYFAYFLMLFLLSLNVRLTRLTRSRDTGADAGVS